MESRNDDPPWSIPIRDSSAEAPRRHATWTDRLPVAPVAIVAVLAFVGVVAAALMIGNEPEDPASPPEVLGERAAAAGSPTTLPATTTTDAPTTSTTARPTTTVGVDGDDVAAPATNGPAVAPTEPTRDGEPEGLPILGPDRVSGGWVAQVSSVPSSAGGNALAVAYDTVTATVPDAVILRGSEWAPLRDGFFVIVSTDHDSAADAVDACDASGRTGRDECFARFLSSIDDTQRTCWRDESGSLAGDCG